MHEHRVGRTSSLNPGVSALAVLDKDRRQFLTGGGDGSIRIWTMKGSLASLRATSQELTATYHQPIDCLAFNRKDQRVLHAKSKRIHSTDLVSLKSEILGLLSAEPLQIEVHPHDPFVVILEVRSSPVARKHCSRSRLTCTTKVDHLDRQVQIFDTRSNNFSAPPCMEFGYREAHVSMERKRSEFRYCKGSTHGALFARGYYGDGTVCVWDYRQTKVCFLLVHFISIALIPVPDAECSQTV